MAATQAARKKVRIIEAQILDVLAESPKSSKELADAVGMTTSYINMRLKVLINEGRVFVAEVLTVPSGFGVASIPMYATSNIKPTVHKSSHKDNVVEVKRDYLQTAFFGEPK